MIPSGDSDPISNLNDMVERDGYKALQVVQPKSGLDHKVALSIISSLKHRSPRESKRYLYIKHICNMLEEVKNLKENITEDILRELQLKIEQSTILFDEKSIYKTSIDLFDRLTCQNEGRDTKTRVFNMRNQLMEKLKDPYISSVLNKLDVYTVEVLVIYALGQMFNDIGKTDPIIKAAAVIDRLGHIVLKERNQSTSSTYNLKDDEDVEATSTSLDNSIIMDERCKKLGGAILNYLIERDLLEIVENLITKNKRKNALYVRCKYDLNLIPVKLNLPMVVNPTPWKIEKQEDSKGATLVTSMTGGYLTESVDVYYRYRLLSSKNPELFKLRMTVKSETDYLPVISALQSVGFRIDPTVLEFLDKNRSQLIKERLLSDPEYVGVNSDEFVSEYIRSISDKMVGLNYNGLLHEFQVESQKARNEEIVLSMAKAYSGYDLYFPAFQDFRGRIYRTGIFNLHEGDLYRSLLLFKSSDSPKKLSLSEIPPAIKVATAKRYDSSFKSNTLSIEWFDNWYSQHEGKDIDSYIINTMKNAKEPFQFMRKAILTLKGGYFRGEPVFMDASSSAYQIMAYLLLDTNIAEGTNLINSDIRYDLYMILRTQFINYLKESNNLTPIIENLFTRKLIKRMFMPLTYGKTIKAIADDIYDVMKQYISYKKCMKLGKDCHAFWCDRYSGIANLLKLFGLIGSIRSSLGKSVKLTTPLFYSYQDYRKFEKQSVWIYSNRKGKEKPTRHKISFNILTTERNVLKSKCSTFANFIHQKDALIAINTVKSFYEEYPDNPMYTVHDCFVSNFNMSEIMGDIYKNTLFKSLGNPIRLINEFLSRNLITPWYPNYISFVVEYNLKEYQTCIDHKIENIINLKPIIFGKSVGYHWIEDPIPTEHLKFFSRKCVSLITDSKKAKRFEERINELINCYNNYVSLLCGFVIDEVYNNKDFIQKINHQRVGIGGQLACFKMVCFSNKDKKNYSLT